VLYCRCACVEFIAVLKVDRPPALNAQDDIQAMRIVLAGDAAIQTSEFAEALN